jgi:hypothetical protein
VICIILGCNSPVILRPLGGTTYRLVGDSFVYGLNDAQALLGKLPDGWRVQVFDHPEQDFRIEHRFYNEKTTELTAHDPRLENDPAWQRVPVSGIGRVLEGNDPLIVDFFRNKATGEIINSDPRLRPEVLERRGVETEWFTII